MVPTRANVEEDRRQVVGVGTGRALHRKALPQLVDEALDVDDGLLGHPLRGNYASTVGRQHHRRTVTVTGHAGPIVGASRQPTLVQSERVSVAKRPQPARQPVLQEITKRDRTEALLESTTVAVVVPAYNEERLLGQTIADIPDFVDRIYVVDDASTDGTASVANGADGRVEVISHERNAGVGAAIVTGYRRAIEEEIDVTCVMAGDGQMDPDDLATLAGAVARGDCDYAKANRLVTGEAVKVIPFSRYVGNAILSVLTKIASGYWHVGDSQSGYTAVSLDTLRELDLDRLYPRYGFPNDLLVHLNVINRRVRDFPSRPIYGIGEESGIRIWSVVPSISWLLLKGFWWRMREKYVFRDFHPLVLLYVLGMLLLVSGLVLGAVETAFRIVGNPIPVATIVLVALLVISGLQFTLFAMWLDMESNKDLR